MVDVGKNVDGILHLWGVLVERQKLVTREIYIFYTYCSVWLSHLVDCLVEV
jgi:hypothetical protein